MNLYSELISFSKPSTSSFKSLNSLITFLLFESGGGRLKVPQPCPAVPKAKRHHFYSKTNVLAAISIGKTMVWWSGTPSRAQPFLDKAQGMQK